MGRTICVHKLFFVFVLTFRTIYVHNMLSLCSELGILHMYRTCNSMNNLLSYCGLVDARVSASEKDLPVTARFSFFQLQICLMFNLDSCRILCHFYLTSFLGDFSKIKCRYLTKFLFDEIEKQM